MFTQRFGSALNSNLHFHALVTDGVFTCPSPFTRAFFHRRRALEDEQVEELTCRLHRRITRYLQRTGHLPRDPHGDEAPQDEPDEPLLAQLGAASVQGRVALGQASGRPVTRLGRRREVQPLSVPDELCCDVDGFSLHAKILVEAHERERLEHLCRGPGPTCLRAESHQSTADLCADAARPAYNPPRGVSCAAGPRSWCRTCLLAHLGLPTEPLPLAPARAPPEPAFDW